MSNPEEDQEEGEILSDEDNDSSVVVEEPAKKRVSPPKVEMAAAKSKSTSNKSESHKSKSKQLSKNEPSRRHHSPPPAKKKRPAVVEDDFSAELEKALAMTLAKRDGVEAPASTLTSQKKSKRSDHDSHEDDDRLKSSSRKRKKRNGSDKHRKKSRNVDEKGRRESNEDFDEYEMLCVRGGSPPPNNNFTVPNARPQNDYYESDNSSASSNYEANENRKRPTYEEKRQRQREKMRRDRKIRNDNARGSGRNRGDSEGEECTRSHESRAPRKMELCKFYLMDCCAKRENCLYLHSDFPCKYYYLGMECRADKCLFMHGKPLNDQLRMILLKHLETAPKEILGDFPRLPHDTAVKLLTTTHKRLTDEYEAKHRPVQASQSSALKPDEGDAAAAAGQLKGIPSLFDIQTQKPPLQTVNNSNLSASRTSERSDKPKKSRWCDSGFTSVPPPTLLTRPPPPITQPMLPLGLNSSVLPSSDCLSLKNLNGVITPEQIDVLEKIGITTVEQLNQLTVGQLSDLGISISQISDIQLNAKNLKMLGLPTGSPTVPVSMTTNESSTENKGLPDPNTLQLESKETPPPSVVLQDLDMRVTHPSIATAQVAVPDTLSFGGQDVDMRFLNVPPVAMPSAQPTVEIVPQQEPLQINEIASPDHQPMAKLSFYGTQETAQPEKPKGPVTTQSQQKSSGVMVDYSQYLRDSNLMTKDDEHEDNNKEESDSPLLIDESWYASDDEKREESNVENDTTEKKMNDTQETNVPLLPAIIDPTSLISSSLNNLSKIDLSASVTQLLGTINKIAIKEPTPVELPKPLDISYAPITSTTTASTPAISVPVVSPSLSDKDTRDPRMRNQRPNDQPSYFATNYSSSKPDNSCSDSEAHSSPAQTIKAKPKTLNQRASIYDHTSDDGENDDDDESDGAYSKTMNDRDMRYPFGTTDFSSNSDVDLRMSLPFKPVHHHVPATEINGSISSYMPKPYKVFIVHIPKARYREIRKNLKKPANSLDPRQRRIFGLGEDDSDDPSYTDPLVERIKQKQQSQQIAEPTPTIASPPQTAPPPAYVAPRVDPRRKKDATLAGTIGISNSRIEPTTPSSSHTIDIQSVINKSAWYKDLSSKQKIMVNQQLALLSTEIKKFQKDPTPDKVFDLNIIISNKELQEVLQNLGVYIDPTGNFIELNDENESSSMSKSQNVAPPNMMGMHPLDFLHLPPPQPGMMAMDNLRFAGPPPMVFPQIRPGLLGVAPPNVRFNPFVDPTLAVSQMIMSGNMGGGGGGGGGGGSGNSHYRGGQSGGNNRNNNNQNNDRWRNSNRRNNSNNNSHRRDRDNKN